MQSTMRRRILSLVMALTLTLGLAVTGFAAEADKVTVTVLQTSDLHGMVNPFDYAANKDSKTSLAHVAAVVAQERKTDPDLLLIDTGDTLQANYIQEFRTEVPNPMIDAMNYLEYDAWTLGNHEFNFEFKSLEKAIGEFKGVTLAGNVYKADGSRWHAAYEIFDVKGVKVAIFGLVAPHVPQWEASDPTRFDEMTFTEPLEETGKIIKELEGKADVILGSIHYGMEGEYGLEAKAAQAIAETYSDQVDGLFIGHAHAKVNETIAGVPVLEPANNGQFVGKMAFTLTQQDGKWTIDDAATTSELLDTSTATPDAAFLAKYKTLADKTLALASKEVGTVGETFMDPVYFLPGIPTAIIQDNPITDLVNMIQMKYTEADVSLAALFTEDANLEKGPFLNRDGVKIYKYDNTLFAVKVTGKQLKAIMEVNGGNFFNTYTPGDVTVSFNPEIRMYNYDMFTGVDYEINISKPAGSRIENVMYNGAPLKDDEVLVLALNNYRYGGLAGAGLIRKEDVVYDSGLAVRDLITEYVAALGQPLMPECDNNWKITGAPLDDPQKDLIYEMVRSGELTIPTSEDGRTPNVAALNGPALRAAGKLPALEGETTAPVAPPVTAPVAPPVTAPVAPPVTAPVAPPVTAPVAPSVIPTVPSGETYTVKTGDCLWSIAQHTYGTGAKWTEIYEANQANIKDPGSIQVGQIFVIPAA